jgi:hypothetical protein
MMAASMLSAYDIVDPIDLHGNKITADTPLEYTNAMVRYVLEFEQWLLGDPNMYQKLRPSLQSIFQASHPRKHDP